MRTSTAHLTLRDYVAALSVGSTQRKRPIGTSETWDRVGIRWGSPWDPVLKNGIRLFSVPFFTGDPVAELGAYIILISNKG